MTYIGLIISIVLGVLKVINVYDCSWWIIIAPTVIAIIIQYLICKGIVGFFNMLSALSTRSYEKGRMKQMEDDLKNDPKYKDL